MKTPPSLRRHPSPSRLSSGVRSALGFGMVETLLTLAGLTVFSVVAFASYQHVSAKSRVSDESDNLRELSTKVENSFGLLGTFAGVSADAIVRDGLAPTRLTDGEGLLTNAWGGAVTVEPYTVTRFGDGFSIVHHQVPARSCADFVAVNARDPWDIQVSDVSVIRNHGGRLDLQALTDACAGGDGRIAFVYHTGLVAGAAVAASPL
ncbi:TPA: type 4 pilus major pilin, partial [Stenotrophomonas maltophilia]